MTRYFKVLALLSLIVISCSNEERISMEAEKIKEVTKNEVTERKIPDNMEEGVLKKPFKEELVFGVTPYLPKEEMKKEMSLVLNYLTDKVGIRFKLYLAETYDDLWKKMKDGGVDFGSFSPLSYINAKDNYPELQLFASQIAEGQPFYIGYIITHKDSGINHLKDFHNKSFAFVDPTSASGYLYPRALFIKEGFNLKTFFSKTVMAGNHEKVIEMVYNKKVDGGATYSDELKRAKKMGLDISKIKIIAKTDPIPYDAYCARKEIPKEIVEKVKKALLALNTQTEEGRKILKKSFRLNGWVEATDKNYDVVRKIQKIVSTYEEKNLSNKVDEKALKQPFKDKLIFGWTPYLSKELMEKEMTPILNYLTDKVGITFKLYLAETYDDLWQKMKEGSVDFGAFPPFAYINAKDNYPELQLFASQIAEGQPFYIGYIITHKDSGINHLKDFHNKSFAFVDPTSASGYLYPRAMFVQEGIEPKTFFSKTVMAGNHEKVIEMVYNKKVDGGATYSDALKSVKSKGLDTSKIKIVAKTDPIPLDAYCARKEIPKEIVEKVKKALLALNTQTKEGRKILGQNIRINGWIEATDKNYDVVRKTRGILSTN